MRRASLLTCLATTAVLSCAGPSAELRHRGGGEEALALESEDAPRRASRPRRGDEPPGPRPGPGPGRVPIEPRARPSSPGVKAGSADDNLQFNAFLAFLEQNGHLGFKHDVSHRLVVAVKDVDGLPLADAELAVEDAGKVLVRRRTYADGRAMIFLSEAAALRGQGARLTVSYRGRTHRATLTAAQGHRLEVKLDLKREAYQRIPIDIAFVLDTTGSMGDEIAQLKKTIEVLNFQISNLSPRPDVRFGMVLYKDKGDEYRTRVIPFTSDVRQFQASLNLVSASGGGDTPEDVQEALGQTMTALQWRSSGAKLGFLIGDAPPHLDYGQSYTYVHAMREAAQKGIKLTTIGCSGLDRTGELVWRQLAQYTLAPFVFLTRGEKGDSEGSAASVSHHVGSNWVAENLDAIIVRMVKAELSHYSPRGAAPTEDYFTASAVDGNRSDDVLTDLFRQSVKQLVDYSVQRLAPRTPTVVMPIRGASPLAGPTKKLETRLALAVGQSGELQLVESRDLSALIRKQSEQLSDSFDAERAVKLGKLLPAKLLVLSKLDEGSAGPAGGPGGFTPPGGSGARPYRDAPRNGKLELLIRLVRLETGEVLSLSLLKIDRALLR